MKYVSFEMCKKNRFLFGFGFVLGTWSTLPNDGVFYCFFFSWLGTEKYKNVKCENVKISE